MIDFCDNCGECFPKATSKFCSACGQRRASQAASGRTEVIHTHNIPQHDSIEEHETRIPFWNVPEYTGTKPITLYDRVYGKKPDGIRNNVVWGKAFLKSHTEYRRQHKKMHKNHCIVREWFLPGTNDFVDKVLKCTSLRWNKSLKKEIVEYCDEKQKSGTKKDLIKALEFPKEGLSLKWKTSDIVRHVFTIKKYRRSSKGMRSQISQDPSQVPLMEITDLVSEVPIHTSELPSSALEVSIVAPEVERIGTGNKQTKPPRIQKPSRKVVEQAS